MENTLSRLNYLALIGISLFLHAGISYEIRANSGAETELLSLQQQVTGVVTDENGLPIPGVAISIKDSSTGTTTDLEGRYSISVGSQDILVFSYLGMMTMEKPVGSRSEINIVLREDVTALGEVQINAGYYHTTRRESTGNISRVTAEEIELQPVVSPIEALQGRMAGVEIIPGVSYPGSATTIRIRGINSLREDGNLPMYIIDGVPVNSAPINSYSNLSFSGIDPLSTLNLGNIESIEVLKDADATAIYGSRGANGVVLITTKKAREGKIKLQANIFKGASTVPGRVDLLNTEQYLQLRKRAFENDGIEPTTGNAYDLLVWDQNRYTDWQDVFFGGTSEMTDINLNLAGGSENNNFRLSGSYSKHGSVYVGDADFSKISASLNARHSSKDKRFNVELSANFGMDIHHLYGYLTLTPNAFSLAPNAPKLFNEDGSLHWDDWNDIGLTNPLQGFHNTSETIGENLNSNLMIRYELIPGLSLKTSLGYTTYSGDEMVKRPPRSFNPAWFALNQTIHQYSKRKSWIIEPQLTFNQNYGKNGLEVLIGGTFHNTTQKLLSLQGSNYVSESIMGNLAAAESIYILYNNNSDYRYNAVFARFGYTWDKKLFLNFTGRRDGSSRFGPGKKIANFGAVGAAWIFSEENWFNQNLSFISFGKLRGSYGTTGNDQIGDYGYLDAFVVTPGPNGIYPNQLSNPDYSWEKNKKLELAVDLGIMKDKLIFGVSWFQNRSSNQLVGYPLSAVTGFDNIQANLPATVENTGWELELNSTNITNKDFQWQTSINFTIPKNRLIDFPNLEESSYANTYRIGHPLNISLLYQYTGLDSDTGFYTVKDVNDDSRLDYEDRTEIWNPGRKFFGGIANNFRYKNLSLSFFFQYVNQEGTLLHFEAGPIRNSFTEVLNALEPGSPYQTISRSSAASRAYSYVVDSTFPIVDASFLKLRTLSLSYLLPQGLLEVIGLEEGKVFLNGHNLLTITNYKGLDPEVPTGGSSFSGLRTISAGVQITL